MNTDHISFEENNALVSGGCGVFAIGLYDVTNNYGLGHLGNQAHVKYRTNFLLFWDWFCFLFWINQLKTKIDRHGIHCIFFLTRNEPWRGDFRWSFFWTQYGTVYNVSGKGLIN